MGRIPLNEIDAADAMWIAILIGGVVAGYYVALAMNRASRGGEARWSERGFLFAGRLRGRHRPQRDPVDERDADTADNP